MQLQVPSKAERDEFGEHVVRIICNSLVGAPETDALERLNKQLPDGFAAKPLPRGGYGSVAYVSCDSAEAKRRVEVAVVGEGHIADLIDGYRKWLSVHSFIYYDMGENVVPDEVWDVKAEKLSYMQSVHGSGAGTWKNEEFEEFSGSTGMHLPRTEEIKNRAQEVVNG